MTGADRSSNSSEAAGGLAANRPPADLWSRLANPSRQPKEGLTLQLIARAGMEIADADGLGAVSMARVARRCGFTTMALYRHVSSKDELLLLMFNEAIGGFPPVPAGLGWAEALRWWARTLNERALRSPWVVNVNPTGLNTPHQLDLLESGLQLLDETGLPLDDRANLLLVLSGMVFAHVRMVADFRATQADGSFGRLLFAADVADRYPAIAALVGSGVFGSADDPPDDEDPHDDFDLGLDLLIDGLAARLARDDSPE